MEYFLFSFTVLKLAAVKGLRDRFLQLLGHLIEK